MKCSKCGASAGNLRVAVYGREKVYSCRLCGNVTYEKPVNIPAPRSKPCTGCARYSVDPSQSTTGLCTKCQNKLDHWKRGGLDTPAPFIEVLGVWVKNKKHPSA